MTPQRRQNKTDPVIVQGKFMTVATEIRTILHFDWSIKPNLISVSVATALILPPSPRQRASTSAREPSSSATSARWLTRRGLDAQAAVPPLPPLQQSAPLSPRYKRFFSVLQSRYDQNPTPFDSLSTSIFSFSIFAEDSHFYRLPPRGKYVLQLCFSMF
jgi:hypothetical protein